MSLFDRIAHSETAFVYACPVYAERWDRDRHPGQSGRERREGRPSRGRARSHPTTYSQPSRVVQFVQPDRQDVEPTVVNISTTYLPKAPAAARNNNPKAAGSCNRSSLTTIRAMTRMDDFLYRFFGGNPFGGGTRWQRRKGNALGSGVVVDKAGYILTNNHVVDKADRIQVKFNDDPTDTTPK